MMNKETRVIRSTLKNMSRESLYKEAKENYNIETSRYTREEIVERIVSIEQKNFYT